MLGLILLMANFKSAEPTNTKVRFKQYFSMSYLETNKNKMPICSALLKYGFTKLNLQV